MEYLRTWMGAETLIPLTAPVQFSDVEIGSAERAARSESSRAKRRGTTFLRFGVSVTDFKDLRCLGMFCSPNVRFFVTRLTGCYDQSGDGQHAPLLNTGGVQESCSLTQTCLHHVWSCTAETPSAPAGQAVSRRRCLWQTQKSWNDVRTTRAA